MNAPMMHTREKESVCAEIASKFNFCSNSQTVFELFSRMIAAAETLGARKSDLGDDARERDTAILR